MVKKEEPKKKEKDKEPEPKKPVEDKTAKKDEKKPAEPVKDKKGDFSDIAAAIAKMQPSQPKPQPNQPAPRPAAAAPATPPPSVPAQPAAVDQEPRASNLTVGLWQRKIQGKIYENWNKPSGLPNESNLAMVVVVEVRPDGSLANPRVGRSSGNAVFDRSVIHAIQKTPTVDQPPTGCPECRELEIVFRPQKE